MKVKRCFVDLQFTLKYSYIVKKTSMRSFHLTKGYFIGLNSTGATRKTTGSTSRKSDTSGCAGYNNVDYQSDDSILEDKADNSITKV